MNPFEKLIQGGYTPTNTRVSSGPPPRGSDDPTKGRLDRPFAVLGLQKLLESSEEEAP